MTIVFDPARHVPDLSHWEGVIDWKLFRPRRVIVKLTEGRNFGDPLAGYNLRAAREPIVLDDGHGNLSPAPEISVEAFHFVTTWDDPALQIEVFAAALWGAYAEGIPTWADLEGRSLSKVWRALGFVRIRKKLKPFVIALWGEMVKRLVDPQGFYVGASFWNTYVGPVNWKFFGLPVPRLWAPDYGKDGLGGGIAEPRWIDRVTWPNSWARWQFTDKGRAPGVKGALDLNFDRA